MTINTMRAAMRFVKVAQTVEICGASVIRRLLDTMQETDRNWSWEIYVGEETDTKLTVYLHDYEEISEFSQILDRIVRHFHKIQFKDGAEFFNPDKNINVKEIQL